MTKIAVYAICKNERDNVKAWLDSVENADEITVLDTGSTDGTVEMFRSRGIDIQQVIVDPWRFDQARSAALSLVNDSIDWCISLDLDERLCRNWRSSLEPMLADSHRICCYLRDHHPVSTCDYLVSRVHRRNGYEWKYRCHEIICAEHPEKLAYSQNVLIDHYPSRKPQRNDYLKLLEQDHKDDPTDLRVCYYLARQLLAKDNDRAWYLFEQASKYPLRYYESRLYQVKILGHQQWKLKEELLMELCLRDPHRREAWVELARIYVVRQDYETALIYYMRAQQCMVRKGLESRELYWSEDFDRLGTLITENLRDLQRDP